MIQKIRRIQGYGCYGDWSDELDSTHQFGRTTVVFGGNGSGKSTLGRLFAEIEELRARASAGADDSAGSGATAWKATLALRRADGTEQTCQVPKDVGPHFVVYNRDYVVDNLARALDGTGRGEPLFVLGADSREADVALDEVRGELANASSRVEKATTHRRDAVSKVDAVLKRARDAVIEQLRAFDPLKYGAPATYSIGKVKPVLQDASSLPRLVPNERREILGRLGQTRDDLALRIPTPPDIRIDSLAEGLNQVRAIEVVGEALASLAAHPAHEGWVRHGFELHSDRDTCIYCEQALPADRVAALRGHFSESHGRLNSAISRARIDVRSCDDGYRALEQWLTDHLGVLSDELVVPAREALASIRAWLDEVPAWLDARQERPYDVPAPEPVCDSVDGALNAVGSWVKGENERRQKALDAFDKQRSSDLSRIETDIIEGHRSDWDEAQRQQDDAGTELDAARTERDELAKRVEAASARRHATMDGERLAKQLTEDLFEYLGHRELVVAFKAGSDGGGYAIMRGHEQAKNLSEGERNAIALLYFLRAFDSRKALQRSSDSARVEDAIVVVDDPVSSLDYHATLAAFHYLKERLVGDTGFGRQTIILTHSYEFFRLWASSLEKHLKPDRETGLPPVTACGVPKASLMTIVARSDGAGKRVAPSLCTLEPKEHKRLYEYHLLFHEVWEAANQPTMRDLPIGVGNSARRLIESYSMFKLPSGSDLTQRVQKLSKQSDLNDAAAASLVKAAHEMSHRETPTITASGPLFDTRSLVRNVLRVIRATDMAHFDGMLEVIGASVQPLPEWLQNSAG